MKFFSYRCVLGQRSSGWMMVSTTTMLQRDVVFLQMSSRKSMSERERYKKSERLCTADDE